MDQSTYLVSSALNLVFALYILLEPFVRRRLYPKAGCPPGMPEAKLQIDLLKAKLAMLEAVLTCAEAARTGTAAGRQAWPDGEKE